MMDNSEEHWCCANCNHYDDCRYETAPGYCYRKNIRIEDCRDCCEHYSRRYRSEDD